MAVTTFYLASAGESTTVLSTSSGFNFTLSRNSGDAIPADAIIDGASLVLSATYQYSALRLFVTAKDGANMHDPRSTSGNSASSNVLESLSIPLCSANFYSGLDSIVITIKGAGKGSASTDGNVFNMRSNCTFTLTVNWHVRTACAAPSNVSLSKILADPSETVTLSWNDASAGSDNPITGYEVWHSVNGGAYTLLQAISTGAVSGSLTVTASATYGTNIKYKIITKGTHLGFDSGFSTEATLTTRTPTAAGAPTSTSVPTLAESDPSLTFSGAVGGTLNGITGYEIQYSESSNGSAWGAWTALKSIATSSTSGSTSVALPSTRGYYRKYRIRTLGAAGSSYYSGWKETGAVRKNSAPSAPTSVVASPVVYESGGVTLTWSGATDVDGNISSYRVQYSVSPDGITWNTWLTVGTYAGTNIKDYPGFERGWRQKFRVCSIDAFGIESGYTESNIIRKNSIPAAPTINYPAVDRTIYNLRPRFLVTVGADTDAQTQSLAANGYTPSSAGPYASGKKIVYRKASNAGVGSVTFSVTPTDALGAAGNTVSRNTTYAVTAWTDSNLAGGTSRIKAAHMVEIRAAVNTVRAYYGLSAYIWAESIVAGLTSMAGWASHVDEIWTAIEQIAAFVNSWDTSGTANNISLPTRIQITGKQPIAAVVQQLRTVIDIL